MRNRRPIYAIAFSIAILVGLMIPRSELLAGTSGSLNTNSSNEAPLLSPSENGNVALIWRETGAKGCRIMIQLLDSRGRALWRSGGVEVAGEPLNNTHFSAVTDGNGGVIVTWEDSRKGAYDTDIYAQRIGRDGNPVWTTGGVPLCTAQHQQQLPIAVIDGRGGAFVFWIDYRNGNADIFGCHIRADGKVEKQFSVCTEKEDQLDIAAAPSESGGVCVVWVDHRYDSPGIYGQYFDADGKIEWQENGLPICTGLYQQETPTVVAVGNDKFVVAWSDYRDRVAKVFVQALNLNGSTFYAAGGGAVSSSTGPEYLPSLSSVGSSSVAITWLSYVRGARMFQARVLLTSPGKISPAYDISMPSLAQFWSQTVADGEDGAVAAWLEYNAGKIEVFAQRANATGKCLWGKSGVILGIAKERSHPQIIYDRGTRDFRIAWTEEDSVHSRVAVERIKDDGTVAWKRVH